MYGMFLWALTFCSDDRKSTPLNKVIPVALLDAEKRQTYRCFSPLASRYLLVYNTPNLLLPPTLPKSPNLGLNDVKDLIETQGRLYSPTPISFLPEKARHDTPTGSYHRYCKRYDSVVLSHLDASRPLSTTIDPFGSKKSTTRDPSRQSCDMSIY